MPGAARNCTGHRLVSAPPQGCAPNRLASVDLHRTSRVCRLRLHAVNVQLVHKRPPGPPTSACRPHAAPPSRARACTDARHDMRGCRLPDSMHAGRAAALQLRHARAARSPDRGSVCWLNQGVERWTVAAAPHREAPGPPARSAHGGAPTPAHPTVLAGNAGRTDAEHMPCMHATRRRRL